MDLNIPVKPAGLDSWTQARWEHSALRRRMLIGNWLQDLEDELARHLPTDRRAAVGVADMSTNVFKGVNQALSALYNEPPTIGVMGAAQSQADPLLARGGLIDQAGLWPMMQEIQLFTLGLREMFLRVGVNSTGDGLLYRPVTPDMVYAESLPADPMQPIYLAELRLRKDKIKGKLIWTYDVFDLKDQNNPKYQVFEVKPSGEIGKDRSLDFLNEDLTGESYPYRMNNNKPVLPYSVFHATLNGAQLFDPFNGAELVAGSLTSGVLHTLLLHLARDCSHPQRYIMGAQLAGAGTYDATGTARRAAIASDPASILVFTPDPEMIGAGQPTLGQFAAGGNPGDLMEMITLYERKLAQSAGISPATVQKVSGDPRSGYAIAMSKSDQRDAQRKYAPCMRFGDLSTLQLSAMIANKFLGLNIPESGYVVEYSAIPLSKDEAEAIRQDIIDKLNNGLMTKIEAIKLLHPDFSTDDAANYLREVKRQNIEFS